MTTDNLYITACEQLDIPVSIAQKQNLSLSDLYAMLDRDYQQEINLYAPEVD